MKIEVGLALLVLLVGSSLQQGAAYSASERSNGAFVRMITLHEGTNKTLKEHAHTDEELRKENENLRKEFEDQKKDFEVIKEELHNHIYYCPDPNKPANTVNTGIKRYENAKIDFSCKEGYVQCNEDTSMTCAGDKTWSVSGTSHCGELLDSFVNPAKETYLDFAGSLPSGTVVTVKGKATAVDSMIINLFDQYKNTILHTSFRSYYRTLVVNRHIGWWQSELRPYINPWPVVVGQDFTYVVKLKGTKFEGYYDGKKLFDYDMQYRKTYKITVAGAATFYSITARAC